MLLPLGRDRRIVGRSARSRLYRDAAAGGRFGTERNAVLARPAWRHAEPQRRPDALADRECAIAAQRARPPRSGSAGMGRRSVPCARHASRLLEHRA